MIHGGNQKSNSPTYIINLLSITLLHTHTHLKTLQNPSSQIRSIESRTNFTRAPSGLELSIANSGSFITLRPNRTLEMVKRELMARARFAPINRRITFTSRIMRPSSIKHRPAAIFAAKFEHENRERKRCVETALDLIPEIFAI